MIIYTILIILSTRAQDVSSREENTEVRSAQSNAGGVRGCLLILSLIIRSSEIPTFTGVPFHDREYQTEIYADLYRAVSQPLKHARYRHPHVLRRQHSRST